MTRITRQLIEFARVSSPHKAPVDLRQVISQTMDLLQTLEGISFYQLDNSSGEFPGS